MARKRMLSPEFFTSAPVNSLSIPAMVTFAGLWCYADDYGRAEDDVTMIKATIWPRRRSQTEAKVASDLANLEFAGLICRYSVAQVPLLHMPTWHEHQQISHRGREKYPPCRSHEPGLWDAFLRDDSPALAKFRRPSGNPPETFQRSVVELNTDKGSSSAGPSLVRQELDKARRRG